MKHLISLTVLFGIIAAAYAESAARCQINAGSGDPSQPISGTVDFTQPDGSDVVTITVQLTGFNKTDSVTQHGFHVHVNGLISNLCADAGSHYNPYNKVHGAPNATDRHVGDLGNIIEDTDGSVHYIFTDNVISLLPGTNGIVNRSVVVHAMPDDLGLGGHPDSNTTGHAGARIGCCVITSLSVNGARSLTAALAAVMWLAIAAFVAKK